MRGTAKILISILISILVILPALPVFAASLTGGYAKIRDWDKTHDAFSFASGQVNWGDGDFFIAPRGIHVFDSPGIIDMGVVDLDDVVEAPTSGYLEMVTPIDGHTYVVRSHGKYGKFYIEETYDWLDPVAYEIHWAYQSDGTRSLGGTAVSGGTASQGQTGGGTEAGCTYEQYIAAYNKLTSLMSAGKGNTPEAKLAYEEYAKMKACYENTLSGSGATTTTGNAASSDCPQSAQEAYQQYIAAYNKLTDLMAQGKGNTSQANAAYQQYVKMKACYESFSSGTQGSSTSTSTSGTSSSSTAQSQQTTAGQIFSYPPLNWSTRQVGQASVSIGQNEICINSMDPGGAWAEAVRNYDIDEDYTVTLDFKVLEKDNHFIDIYCDEYVFLAVDWGTNLVYHQPGSAYNVRQMSINLEVNRWYNIRLEAHPAQGTFDIFIDNTKMGTATNIFDPDKGYHYRNPYPGGQVELTHKIYIGDVDDLSYRGGSYDKGSACWRNISVTSQPGGSSAVTSSGMQQLYPVADGDVYAYSYRNWNWANWGRYVTMGAGWNPTGGGRRSYLRFDLPAGQGFSKAVLKLYQYHQAGSAHSLGVYRVTSPWAEGTDTYHSGEVEEKADPGELCWMQQPSFDPVPVATFNSANTVPLWVEVDITSLVQQWQAGTANYGLMIKRTDDQPATEGTSAYFTKENTDLAHRPVLVLSSGGTVPPAPTPTNATNIFGSTDVLTKGFKGNIYYLEEGTSILPDFSRMTPVGTIYTEKLDISDRDFTEGFPGITNRYEWFGISYIGGMVTPVDGNYTFKLTSDDGAKLYIDGELLIENDGIHPASTKTKTVNLTRGDHQLKIDYFQGPKTRLCLQLFVQTPDGGEAPVKPELDPSKLAPISIKSTTLFAESRTTAQGSTVMIPVYLQNASNVGSLGFNLAYNPSVAQVIKVHKGSLMSSSTFTFNVQNNNIVFGFATTQDISGTGSAAIVEFKATGTDGSKSPLTLSQILATNSSGGTVSVNALNGELSIGQKQSGDGNGDGKISVLDALMALKMYVQLLPVDLILDVNKDGRITPEDARLIIQMSKPK